MTDIQQTNGRVAESAAGLCDDNTPVSGEVLRSGINVERMTNPYGALTQPVARTATFEFRDTADLESYIEGKSLNRFEYGRYGSPTVQACEERFAAMEGAEKAALFPSGMNAATTFLLSYFRPRAGEPPEGGTLVLGDDLYRRTRQFCEEWLSPYGVNVVKLPMDSFRHIDTFVGGDTRMIFVEAPTNPYLRVPNLKLLAETGKALGITTVVDSTFATPVNLRPLDLGIDIVLHSGTKYLSGTNDTLAGFVMGRSGLIDPIACDRGILGGMPTDETAKHLLNSAGTLDVRMERFNKNGLDVARFLESSPHVGRVWYPGLESHPDHKVAASFMQGYGGVVTFEYAGSREDTSRFIDELRIAHIAPSFGSPEVLIEQPRIISYYEYSDERCLELGIKPNLVRLAVGLLKSEELIHEMERAFRVASLRNSRTI